MQGLIANLRWRGMIHQMTPGTELQLNTETTSGYIGFDPTAPSLHIGTLATIMLLKHFQLAGHKPIIVVGGATGMIGDPSGKVAERPLLSEEELCHNQTCIGNQLQHFLDFSDHKNGAIFLNNLTWLKKTDLLSFLREAGKHISVNHMMAKDSVKKRLETGISFTEFTYQLLQGYDFYYLYKHHHVKLQLGGSDQWGNLTTGIEMIRRKTGCTAFALTTPLITKQNGQKFGKTERGTIWLDPTMTSPHVFYQFWLNCSDEEANKCIKTLTLLDPSAIERIIQQHNTMPHERILQKTIAKELTIMVHSEHAYQQAAQAAAILFGNSSEKDLQTLSEQTLLAIFADIPKIIVGREAWICLDNVTDLVSVATQGSIFASRGAARRMIQEGGVKINKSKITNPYQKPNFKLLQGRYLLVQQGKKHYYLIIVQ
mmetsp:Transcript_3879/g.8747  ORF Transcript_3879/g.8747 Transcript_3879/m.8747 type:complete len:428 (-) Transcript_3879:9717-11000(-)